MNTHLNIASRVALVVLSTIGLATSALAGPPPWAKAYGRYDRDDRYDRDAEFARVVNVEPIVHRVRVSTPERECWNEERPVYGGDSGTVARSTLVGGLIGAAIGHRINFHAGTRDPAAVIGGSIIGAAIGNSIGVDRTERRGEYRPVGYEPVERCRVNYRDDWEDHIDGYRVTYLYHGREFTTRMPYDPGQRIRVNVAVSPEFRDEDGDN
jgi:uncharacterized protein YcfJ